MKRTPFPPLTDFQQKAIKAFISQHTAQHVGVVGRYGDMFSWVDALIEAWMRGGGYPTWPVDYSGTLHALRNTHGTAWLHSKMIRFSEDIS
jgi:hypothetical protein